MAGMTKWSRAPPGGGRGGWRRQGSTWAGALADSRLWPCGPAGGLPVRDRARALAPGASTAGRRWPRRRFAPGVPLGHPSPCPRRFADWHSVAARHLGTRPAVELPGQHGLAVLFAQVGAYQFVSREKEHHEAQPSRGPGRTRAATSAHGPAAAAYSPDSPTRSTVRPTA